MKNQGKILKTIFNIMIAFTMVFASFSLPTVFNAEGAEDTQPQNDTTVENESTEIIEETEEQTEEVQVENFATRDNDTGVSMEIPNAGNLKFQTYKDPITGLGPNYMNVPLAINMDKAGVSGLKIFIPYDGFQPKKDNSAGGVYEHFTMDEDIFEFDANQNNSIPSNSIVKRYENDADNNRLIVYLEDTTQGLETVNVRFKFNQNYSSLIPPTQVIWENAHAILVDEHGAEILRTTNASIRTSAPSENHTNLVRQSPSDGKVDGDTAQVRAAFRNNNRMQSKLDESGDNIYYLDIPKNIEYTPTGAMAEERVYTENLGDVTRYIFEFHDDSESFKDWNKQGDPNQNYTMNDYQLSGFDKLNVGDEVKINIGMNIKKINAEMKNSESEVIFTKVNAENFSLHFNP